MVVGVGLALALIFLVGHGGTGRLESMTKFLGLLAMASTMVQPVFAVSDCEAVSSDLKAMQSARATITQSLISNHETFAVTLEDYSGALNTSAAMGQSVTKDAVINMNESAKAFRVRGQNAQKLNQKLNQASDQVIAKAIECLKFKKH
jgi:23S rRNA G2445 N2-methylase RlmL